MKKLEHYRKKTEKIDFKVTSVNLTQDQYKFIQDNHISLSELVRDFIQDLMNQKKGK